MSAEKTIKFHNLVHMIREWNRELYERGYAGDIDILVELEDDDIEDFLKRYISEELP